MSRQEWNQMFRYADRTYARTTTTVRRGKSLVQVQVANVGTNRTGVCQAYLCIHICTVHIYLCTTIVDDAADFDNFSFKNTVCGRIGNHQCGKILFILFCFGTQVVHVYITLFITSASHGSEASLDG